MITDTTAFLRYFDAVHRRALRDVTALPPAAARWRPAQGDGERGWSIGQIVAHIGASRLYFASAYRGEGWIYPEAAIDPDDAGAWAPWLERSADEFRRRLQDTPNEWLTRRVAMIDSDGTLSGWRVLLMMVEHDIHHRSQIDTYAGLEGWEPPHIYGRSYEGISALQAAERAKHGRAAGGDPRGG